MFPDSSLANIDKKFISSLKEINPELAIKLLRGRKTLPSSLEISRLIIEIAPILENFIADLFNIKQEVQNLQNEEVNKNPLFHIKRQFVQRYALRGYSGYENSTYDFKDQLRFALEVQAWLKDKNSNAAIIEEAAKYAAWAVLNSKGQEKHKDDSLFKFPKKLDFENLAVHPEQYHPRDGFDLLDEGFNSTQALDQANYCINCHPQGKDSCSRGLKVKDTDDYQRNALNVSLEGCPLNQKISEMNYIKSRGYNIGALAIVIIDNPMIAATGHRICNDCMRSCIYQKQEPVHIPGVETQILRQVLNLPFGFEIYSLLTRWNPLNFAFPLLKLPTNKTVMIVGQGPSGFTLAHYLLNEGHCVIAIDGLKIEPLKIPEGPIRNINMLLESLDDRIIYGFGGVAEYGITTRWDKNFLKIIRLLLERRDNYYLFGGIRLGSNILPSQAYELGIDHIAMCIGAGKPILMDIPNSLARGVRHASDFLMNLQLLGAFKKNSLANLQVRLPALVIGGGLTAIDAATELQAYYIRQVEKFAQCSPSINELNEEDKTIASEFLSHANEIKIERMQAEREGRAPNFISLIQKWGGVQVVYRKRLQESPAYKLNHEEVQKAFEQGIGYIQNAIPFHIELDEYHHVKTLLVKQHQQEKAFPAHTIIIAAGTQPNTSILYDDPELAPLVRINGKDYFGEGPSCIINEKLSFFGDMHPTFSGSVVKAMASAKRGYQEISHILNLQLHPKKSNHVVDKLNKSIITTIRKIEYLAPGILEIIIYSPLAAENFKPGQFYRLQNYEIFHPNQLIEPLALTGACVDKKEGTISLIILEMGTSSSLCHKLKVGEPVVLMGPTGTPTHIPSNEHVLLVGGGLGNAVLFSIGKAMREKGCYVTYVAGYKKKAHRFKIKEIQEAADVILWCCEENPGFEKVREEDKNYIGNVISGLHAFKDFLKLNTVDRIIVIGSDNMMEAIKNIHHIIIPKPHVAYGSINSPMQCMMKEICAQCLQRHIDPQSGLETIVFSCVNQDQPLDHVDFKCLKERLQQNRLLEKMNNHTSVKC